MKEKLGKRFWAALVIFGLMGQVAWVVENMYLNVFLYKIFHGSAADISWMVAASAATATVTTLLMGALSDHIGKRKRMVCVGYIAWGISILGFALIRMELLVPLAGSVASAAALGIFLVILLDCIMTFLGSMANDAAFNAWMTDWGGWGGRGRIEGINAMMPLVAILVVFGGFMAFDLEQGRSWTMIFLIIGAGVLLIGLLGLFLMEDIGGLRGTRGSVGYWQTVCYSFRPAVFAEHKLLYAVIGAFAVFGISINVFMPYLILYYEKSLGMTNYVLVMAPAILLAAVITAFYGKLFDMVGFKGSVLPSVAMLMLGYAVLYFGRATAVVFLGSLLMMTGYLTGMAVFGAMIRSHIPDKKSGQFQGIRMIGQVLVPGMAGPAIGAAVLSDAKQVVNNDGTTSFIPDTRIFLAAFLVAALLLLVLAAIFYRMRHGHHMLLSEAGERVQKGARTWNRYPRPQMKREAWRSLNEGWELDGRKIRLPFPPQALLSGYGKRVGSRLEYTLRFPGGELAEGKRVLLHFGAVDQIAEVSLNGICLGRHEGGYLPFTFDMTQAIRKENLLQVSVQDRLDRRYPYGKQRKRRGGMWYTPVSGIWQSVWMEEVPSRYVKRLTITPKAWSIDLAVEMNDGSVAEGEAVIWLSSGEQVHVRLAGGGLSLDLRALVTEKGVSYRPRQWSPEDPYLYRAAVTVGKDRVETYFALRQVEILKVEGVPRVCLNGKPVFLNGVLDQGYFCDGIYLPAEEEEYERDIQRMQELGINLLRKHIKIEPECFYEYCDRHGMLVMQDLVNNGNYSFLWDTALPTLGKKKQDDTKRLVSKKTKAVFEEQMEQIIGHLYNHPCIIAYTIFNEGWGQFDSDRLYERAKALDPGRLYDSTSGWFAQEKSDFDSLHIYFGDERLKPDKRPMLLSEFGGFSLAVPGHVYGKYSSYGYGECQDRPELMERIAARYEELLYETVKDGVCGCVYTQLSDVEDEINGFYTYDRRVCKADPKVMRRIAGRLAELSMTR